MPSALRTTVRSRRDGARPGAATGTGATDFARHRFRTAAGGERSEFVGGDEGAIRRARGEPLDQGAQQRPPATGEDPVVPADDQRHRTPGERGGRDQPGAQTAGVHDVRIADEAAQRGDRAHVGDPPQPGWDLDRRQRRPANPNSSPAGAGP